MLLDLHLYQCLQTRISTNLDILQYLQETLGDVVRTILKPDLDCEVDPSKAQQSLNANKLNLLKQCNLVWDSIHCSQTVFPV